MTSTLSWNGHSIIAGTFPNEQEKGTTKESPEKESAEKESFQAENPSSGELLAGHFFEANHTDVDRAVDAATTAFAEGLSQEQRVELLERIATALESLGDSLIDRTQAETALPQQRLIGERGRTCNQLRQFAEYVRSGQSEGAIVDTALPERQPLPRPDVRSCLHGLGPVAIFGAANFPLAFSVAGGDTAAALAAGCPVIFKAHPAHPGCSELVGKAIAEVIKEMNIHPGWFSLLQGRGHEAGQHLVAHPRITGGAFTGSLHGGRALFDIAHQRPKPIPFHAEMGSANPVFILPELENQEQVGSSLAAAVCLGAGQFCVNPGIMVVVEDHDKGHHEIFLNGLTTAISAKANGTLLHRGIAQAYNDVLEHLDAHPAITCIAQPTHKKNEQTGACEAEARAYSISATDFLNEPSLWDERFGPVTLVVRCQSINDVFEIAASMPGSLTATIHGPENETARQLTRLLIPHCGRILWGGVPTGVEVCPAMMHGGPYPAATDSRVTSVGITAITRFQRRVCFQNLPQALLPKAIRDDSSLPQMRNGSFSS